MKIKDVEKYVESTKKLNEFLGKDTEVRIELSDKYSYKNFTNFKNLIKYFNEEYYGELTKETEVVNEDGYIAFYVTYELKNWNCEEHKFEYEEKTDRYTIFIEVR